MVELVLFLDDELSQNIIRTGTSHLVNR